MGSFIERFQGLLGAVTSQLRHPFGGAFIASWLVWNYKIVLVLLGEGRYEDKIHYLTTAIFKDWSDAALTLGLWPALTAALFGVLEPLASTGMVWVLTHVQRWQKQIALNNSKTATVSRAEYDDAVAVFEARLTELQVKTDEAVKRMADEKKEVTPHVRLTKLWLVKLIESAQGRYLGGSGPRVRLVGFEELVGPAGMPSFLIEQGLPLSDLEWVTSAPRGELFGDYYVSIPDETRRQDVIGLLYVLGLVHIQIVGKRRFLSFSSEEVHETLAALVDRERLGNVRA